MGFLEMLLLYGLCWIWLMVAGVVAMATGLLSQLREAHAAGRCFPRGGRVIAVAGALAIAAQVFAWAISNLPAAGLVIFALDYGLALGCVGVAVVSGLKLGSRAMDVHPIQKGPRIALILCAGLLGLTCLIALAWKPALVVARLLCIVPLVVVVLCQTTSSKFVRSAVAVLVTLVPVQPFLIRSDGADKNTVGTLLAVAAVLATAGLAFGRRDPGRLSVAQR